MKNSKPDQAAAGVAGRVVSNDGTAIAFNRFGRNRSALVLVGGAFNDSNAPAAGAPLAQLLSATFTVYAYDRRGRGASGDRLPYGVAREVEDLAAIIAEAGGRAFVHGMSSGGVLALRAAASGLAIDRLSLYEPPFSIDGAAQERAKAYSVALTGMLAAGRRGDAAALFMAHVGMPATMIEGMRSAPMWPALEAMAPTLAYDSAVMGDDGGAGPPARLIEEVRPPCLVIAGGASPNWMRKVGKSVAEVLPNGRFTVLDGQTHDVSIEALAPVLQAYFAD